MKHATPDVSVLMERRQRPSADVKVGDIIEIGFGTRTVKVEVLAVAETTRKDEAKELFKYL